MAGAIYFLFPDWEINYIPPIGECVSGGVVMEIRVMLLWSALAQALVPVGWERSWKAVWRKHRLGMGQEEMAGERHSVCQGKVRMKKGDSLSSLYRKDRGTLPAR